MWMLKGVFFPYAGMEQFYVHTGGYQGAAEEPEFPVSLRHTRLTCILFWTQDTKGQWVTMNTH